MRRNGAGWTKFKGFHRYGIRLRTRIIEADGNLQHQVYMRNYALFDAEVLTHFVVPSITSASYAAATSDLAYESVWAKEWVRLWNLGDRDDRQCHREAHQILVEPEADLEFMDAVYLAEHPGDRRTEKTLFSDGGEKVWR